MSKLIYSATSTVLESNLSGVYQSGTIDSSLPGYKSIAFTGDGYLYTHGLKFRIYKIVNNTAEGLHLGWDAATGYLNLLDGATLLGTIEALGLLEGDSIITATRGTGLYYNKYTLTHAQPQGLSAASYGGVTSASSVNIPSITVDTYGHITAISNVSLDATKVKASAIVDNDNSYYKIIGVSNTDILSPKYYIETYIDKNGTIYERNVSLANKYAAKQVANDTITGTVKLSDALDGGAVTENNVITYLDASSGGTAATPYAIKLALDSAKRYAEGLFTSNDALVFIGTLSTTGKFKSHNSNILPAVINNTSTISDIDYKTGYTAKFVESGNITIGAMDNAVTFAVETGDMLVCLSDRNEVVKGSDFTVIQSNIDGAVTSSDTLQGIVIGDDSRDVSSFAYPSSGSKVLTGTSEGLEWKNYSSIWRTFYLESNEGAKISDKDIIMKAATGSDTNNPLVISFGTSNGLATITYTINPKAIASNAISSLTLVKGDTSFIYDPTSSDLSLTIGNGLSLISTTSGLNTTYTLDHPTYTGISTATLGAITVDSYGHVTGITSVNSLKNPNALYIATTNNSNTVLLSSGTYDGSKIIGYNFKAGTDVSITATAKTTSDGIIYSGTNRADGIELEFGITHKYRPVSIQVKSGNNYAEATSILANTSSNALVLKEGDNITLSNSSGVVTLNALDTWRPVTVYATNSQNTTITLAALQNGSRLIFNSDLVVDDGELGICWTEIDSEGHITYTN